MTLIHELTAAGQHRIVQVNDDGTNKTGDWVETRELAELDKYLANASAEHNGLPPGIFTVRECAYQSLA